MHFIAESFSRFTGNWGVQKNNYVKSGVVQVLSRLSYGATLSHMRRVNIPMGKETKNSAIRQINSSQIMFICPAETPEGASVGIVLNLSLLTRVSECFPTHLVKSVLDECEHLVLVRDMVLGQCTSYVKVMLNGIYIGITTRVHAFVREFKDLRDVGMLTYEVSINYDPDINQVNIYSDAGRVLRPVLPVKNGKLLISSEDGYKWDKLVDTGVIRYVDNNELYRKRGGCKCRRQDWTDCRHGRRSVHRRRGAPVASRRYAAGGHCRGGSSRAPRRTRTCRPRCGR